MLWKCCTQYASKFGKLCSGHKTGRGQFSFQSQRRTCHGHYWILRTVRLETNHILLCDNSVRKGIKLVIVLKTLYFAYKTNTLSKSTCVCRFLHYCRKVFTDFFKCLCIWSIWLQIIQVLYNNGEGYGTPLQYSCLENPMDGGAWWAAVHGVAKSQTRLSDFTFSFHFHALEKEMATHSSVLAWRIPGTGKPGGLPSRGHTESDTTEVT